MSREERKIDHIRHALSHPKSVLNHFDEVQIIHQSHTSSEWEKLNIRTEVGELNLSSPLFVNAMTGGGGKKTEAINRSLAEVAHETGIAMAVGSQMSAIKNPEEESSYRITRKVNPHGIIFANVGSEATLDQAKKAVDMIEANALQIHLNPLQELVMPEGDRDFSCRMSNISQIVDQVEVPVLIKEVGFGISRETAIKMKELGVSYIDVGGRGGTNFSMVENKRRDKPLSAYDDWGIPTPISIMEVNDIFPESHIIASGGIRHGLDGVKALVLGARAFGMAGSLLEVLVEEGQEALIEKIHTIHQEVKIAMMLLEAEYINELSGKPHVFFGRTREWITQRRNEKMS
ncbi:type 2 isopentenyl-diphosphate Delta-isomerase [Thalassobacillus pellis]|uniref:type 2 isopentenyl-diphosphate Delta-isomerase n=1 Tax=Thalassobacillus pellis TaxID=748008 RepID=UPI00195F25F9|nr:type 2 isopentenyl-diphosphate Delta-isomerase [Thalassobacillus pellis]MBM7552451.1 isopentenyl-diphosphate delta-isomerase [Thalassobacillus pellis]